MESTRLYLLAADLMLGLHVLIVVFVICGLLLTLLGGVLSWRWVRNFWFRLAHLVAIGIVVLQSWLGQACPLTVWEMALRERAGVATYPGSFIAHWLGEWLYVTAPEWVFALVYTLFGAVVVATWFWVRPRRA